MFVWRCTNHGFGWLATLFWHSSLSIKLTFVCSSQLVPTWLLMVIIGIWQVLALAYKENALFNASRAWLGLAYLPCYQKEENWKLFSCLADHTNSLAVFPCKWAFHELVFCHVLIINPSCPACVIVHNFISTINSIEKSRKNPRFFGWFSTEYCLPEKQSNSPCSVYQKRIVQKEEELQVDPIPLYFWLVKIGSTIKPT